MVARLLFRAARWLAQRFALCGDCGKDELCWQGRCLQCAGRHERTCPTAAMERIAARIEAMEDACPTPPALPKERKDTP